MRVSILVLGLCLVVACGDDDTSLDAASDMQTDVVADVTEDTNVDGPSCAEVTCAADCREYTEDGCTKCLCSEAPQCQVDADCVLGNLAGTCCPGCPASYSQSQVSENQCVVGRFEPSPAECQPTGCSSPCPQISCQRALSATCNAGTCQPNGMCPEGQVDGGIGGCAPPCSTNDDCVIRRDLTGCCPGCPFVVHKDTATKYACLIEDGATNPDVCEPSGCEAVDCPAIGCDEIVAAICNDQGVCEGTLPR